MRQVLGRWDRACPPPGGTPGSTARSAFLLVLLLTTLPAPLVALSPPETGHATNLLLVTVDTLRADHVGAYGYRAGSTPSLDRLAAGGVRFATAWSPVPLTLPAHASILSGLLPPHHGLRNNGAGRLSGETETLATALGRAGYRTGAFVSAFVLDRRFGLGRGFETYDDEIAAPARAEAGLEAERSGHEVVDRAIAWLGAGDGRPFFLWVHLYEPHAPYEPPEPFRSRFAASPYDGEIATADAELGRLLAALGGRASTVVAVCGDHGEALGEHGELTHGLLVYEPTLRVPLVISGPGLGAARSVETPVSLVDLAPTLAALVGQPLQAAVDGRDLSPALRAGSEPAAVDLYAESRYPAVFGWSPLSAVRRGGLKLISAPRPELYDLTADATETSNRYSGDPVLAAGLERRLAELAGDGVTLAPAPIDEETHARLAALGYATGAERVGTAAAARDPKDAVALFRDFEEAHWALLDGKLHDARQRLERLVAADPGNAVFIGQLAETCRRGGDLGRAISLYQQALAISPDDADARYNLAVTFQEAGRRGEAVAALKQAIALDSARPEAHNALGIALSLGGELETAAEQFREAVRLEPRNARAVNNLGNVLRELGRLEEAEQAFRRAIELEQNYADPYNGLGAVEVQAGRPQAAADHFQRAIALAPGQLEAWLNLAIAREMGGDRAAAMAAYEEFIARAAGDSALASQREAAQQLLARLRALSDDGIPGGGK